MDWPGLSSTLQDLTITSSLASSFTPNPRLVNTTFVASCFDPSVVVAAAAAAVAAVVVAAAVAAVAVVVARELAALPKDHVAPRQQTCTPEAVCQ